MLSENLTHIKYEILTTITVYTIYIYIIFKKKVYIEKKNEKIKKETVYHGMTMCKYMIV